MRGLLVAYCLVILSCDWRGTAWRLALPSLRVTSSPSISPFPVFSTIAVPAPCPPGPCVAVHALWTKGDLLPCNHDAVRHSRITATGVYPTLPPRCCCCCCCWHASRCCLQCAADDDVSGCSNPSLSKMFTESWWWCLTARVCPEPSHVESTRKTITVPSSNQFCSPFLLRSTVHYCSIRRSSFLHFVDLLHGIGAMEPGKYIFDWLHVDTEVLAPAKFLPPGSYPAREAG